MPRRCDLWRIGIVDAPIEAIARAGSFEPFAVRWLEEPEDFRFVADPFAVQRDGELHLFAEAYDYRERQGRIVHRTVDADGASPWQVAVKEPWHLSYPVLVEEEGVTFMLPEASKSGGLWLYRATYFPLGWTRIGEIAPDIVPSARTAPIATVDGISNRITATNSTAPEPSLPHGSSPSVENMYFDSSAPVNLKKSV